MDRKVISVKLNNCATNDPCAICGERTDPAIGPELFLADTFSPVCDTCAQKHSPELWAMVHSWRYVAGQMLAAAASMQEPIDSFLTNGCGAVDIEYREQPEDKRKRDAANEAAGVTW